MGEVPRFGNLLLLILGLSAAGATGCGQVLDVPSFRLDPTAPARDAAIVGPCEHARPPPRPVLPETQRAVEFTVAVETVDLGDWRDDEGLPASRKIGYDLDGKCTGRGEGDSCIRGASATADDTDGPGGIDNSGGRITEESIRQGYYGERDQTKSVNAYAKDGLVTQLYRIEDYNGLPNDTRVKVSAYAGGTSKNPDPTVLGLEPKWHGTDQWYPVLEFLESSGDVGASEYSIDRPKYFDEHAYVTDGVLVAELPAWLTSSGPMSQVMLTARIARDDAGQWYLEGGVAVGRISASTMLKSLGNFHDSLSNQLCSNSPDYPTAKANICSQVDINYESIDDGSAPCNAITLAWRFETTPAVLAGPADPFEFPRQCPLDDEKPPDDCP
jgi:hypothetical protein